MSQLSFFDISQEKLAENRSEAQLRNKVSYDVGETIQGSRKQQAALKRLFSERKTEALLLEIEHESPVLAAELITKQELFSQFSLQEEKEKGTEPEVARLKQLIINRIDTSPKDKSDCRLMYLHAAQELLKRFNSLLSWNDVQKFISEIGTLINYEHYSMDDIKEKIESVSNTISIMEEARNTKVRTYFNLCRRLARYKAVKEHLDNVGEMKISILGDKFTNLFIKQTSLNSAIRSAQKANNWADLLDKKATGSKKVGKSANKPVWERALPDRPDRVDGRLSTINKPEELASFFGFPAIQFGHYVEDKSASEHIFRCSEALMDLADILAVTDTSMSLKNRLKLSFGARGRGKALASYERGQKVINFTKNKGTLGVLAHEFGHSLDNFLYDLSHDFKNGKSHYLSELESLGDNLPQSVIDAMQELMKAIKEGNSTAYFLNENQPGIKPRETLSVGRIYRNADNLAHAVELLKAEKDQELKEEIEILEYYNPSSTQREVEKLENKYFKEFKKLVQALAWLDQQVHGKKPDKIPYPSNTSTFYQNALALDGGKVKYWAADCELFARVFESYIESKLKQEGRKSDYLVVGTTDVRAYPCGEERKNIHEKVEILIKEISTLL